MSDPRKEELRASDLLQDHRLAEHDRKLSDIQEAIFKITETLQVLTRVEIMSVQMSKDIAEVKERQNRQGVFMDAWAIDLEKTKGVVEQVKEKQELHHKIFATIGKVVVTALVTAILGLVIIA